MMEPKKTAFKTLDVMTTSDVAKELGVTIRSVQMWVEKGEMAVWKTPGGHRRISRESFNQFASRRRGINKTTDNTSRLKVVVVEDDPTMLALYRLTIDSWELPLDAKYITNSWQGVVCISQDTPDLLITDLNMPEMDGFSMLKTMRGLEEFSKMAIVVVTGLSVHEIQEKGGLPTGIRIYGKSPVPFWEMKELVRGLLDRKSEQ